MKSDRYAFRSLSVLIVCIIPCLASFYLCSLRLVAVCYCCSFDLLCVADRYFRLVYCILDLCLSVFFMLGQSVKTSCPVVFGIEFKCLALYCLSVCIKLYGYRFRSLSILILCIIPYLVYRDACNLRCVCVCYCVALCSISCNNYFISGRSYFFYCISDLFLFLILGKLLKRSAPVVIRIKLKALVCSIAICKKLNCYACRSYSQMIFISDPVLSYCQTRFTRSMFVGNIVSFYYNFVAFNSIFCDRVLYLLAVFIIFSKVLKFPLPTI